MKKIRLGMVGCGAMSTNHQSNFSWVNEVAEYTCTCDIVEERAKQAAEIVGAPLYFKHYQDMVDHVDAVLLVLPHELHCEVSCFFMRAGKHVLCEKPLAVSEAECIKMIDCAEENNVKLMTAYPLRYWPEIIKLKELVDSGEYGDAFQMSIWTEQYTHRESADTWYHSIRGLGGGQLFSHGCHYIDLMLWFLGRPVEGMHLGTNFGTPWMEREGTSNVVIKFENGALGYHMGTWGARGTQHDYCIQIHCTKGMLEWSRPKGMITFYKNTKSDVADVADETNTEVLFECKVDSKKTELELTHFLECIIEDKKPLSDPISSLQGLRVIWKLYQAEEKGIVADLRGLGFDEPYRTGKEYKYWL